MAKFLTINGTDFSKYVNELKVTKNHNYNAQMNAAGDTVIDYINAKYSIEVGFRPLKESEAGYLFDRLMGFSITLGFRDPHLKTQTEIQCVAPDAEFEYYYIHNDGILSKPFTLTFTQL